MAAAAAAALGRNRESHQTDDFFGALSADTDDYIRVVPGDHRDSNKKAVLKPRKQSMSRLEEELRKEAEKKIQLASSLLDNHGHWLVDSPIFKAVIMILVICNSIIMGVEVDYPDWKTGWKVFDHVFGGAFFLEMLMKLAVLRSKYFRDRWNWLDGTLGVMGFMDTWFLTLIGGSGIGLQQFSILRILRLLRLVRIARLFRQFNKLVIIIKSILDAIESTFWVSCLLTVCIYVCAIFCVDFIDKDMETYPGYSNVESVIDDQEVMTNFNPHLAFGGMSQAMLTLFNIAIMAEWTEVVRPVMVKQPAMVAFFVAFSIFVCFGIMNVIIGMIVDNVMCNARMLEKEIEDVEKKEKVCLLQELRNLVFGADLDGDADIKFEELELLLGATEGRAAELMDKINLPYGCGATEFLAMLDVNGNGKLEYDEFIQSLYRLMTCTGFQQTCLIQMGINDLRRKIGHLEVSTNTNLKIMATAMQSIARQMQKTSSTEIPFQTSPSSRANVEAASVIAVPSLGLGPTEKIASRVDEVCQNVETAMRSKLREELVHTLDKLLTPPLPHESTKSNAVDHWEAVDTNSPGRVTNTHVVRSHTANNAQEDDHTYSSAVVTEASVPHPLAVPDSPTKLDANAAGEKSSDKDALLSDRKTSKTGSLQLV